MLTSQKRSLRLLGLVALVAVAAHAALLFGPRFFATPATTPAPVTTTTPTYEEQQATAIAAPEGVITFTAAASDALRNYQYDLTTNQVTRLWSGVPMAHAVLGEERGVAVLQNESGDGAQPAWFNFATDEYAFFNLPDYATERDIAGNVLENALAYSATNNDASDTWYDLENWDVVIRIIEQDYTKVIENAAHPQWLVGDETLVYLKADGVYHYDLTTDTETRLIDTYTGLTFYDDIATSYYDAEDGATLALTVPSLGAVDTYYFTDPTTLVPIYPYRNEEAIYTDPVISQDGSTIAVLDQTADTPTLQFFSAGSGQPTQKLTLSGLETDVNVLLDGWFERLPALSLGE